jgi:hypothetical protein
VGVTLSRAVQNATDLASLKAAVGQVASDLKSKDDIAAAALVSATPAAAPSVTPPGPVSIAPPASFGSTAPSGTFASFVASAVAQARVNPALTTPALQQQAAFAVVFQNLQDNGQTPVAADIHAALDKAFAAAG